MLIDITIQGQTPIMFNRFTDEAALAATNGTRGALKGASLTPQEQAAEKLYVDEDGDPIIPQTFVNGAFITAGKYFKVGKSKLTTQKTSLLPSSVQVLGVSYKIRHKDPWKVDTRPVRIPSTGGRILCHRPMFDDWEIDFTADLDTDEMSETFFRQVVDKAGKSVGLGAFRPDLKGPYGKFAVISWVAHKEEKKAA